MLRFVKSATILLAILALATPLSAAQYRRGPVVVGRPHYARPYYGIGPGWYGFGWYDPWGPGYYVAPNTGEVKLSTHFKDALVYVDNGYAGVAEKLKHFDLPPGPHDIELRDSIGQTIYHQRIEVILDKTIKLTVD